MTCLRTLQFLAQDYRSYQMIKAQDITDEMDDDIFTNVKVQKYLAGAGKRLHTLHARTATKIEVTGDAETRLGVKVVDELIHQSADGGMAWVQATVENDMCRMPNIDRTGAIHFALSKSPMFAYVVSRVQEIRKQGKRTLIVVNSPWIQM